MQQAKKTMECRYCIANVEVVEEVKEVEKVYDENGEYMHKIYWDFGVGSCGHILWQRSC